MTSSNAEYDKKLLAKGSTYRRIGEYKTALIPIEHECLGCGNIYLRAPKTVLKSTTCPTCRAKKATWTNEIYDEKIKQTRYRRVGTYINNLTNILHECLDCGSTHEVRPQSVIQGHKCKFCSNRALKTTAEYIMELGDRNIEVIGEYKGRQLPLVHKCTVCGNLWEATPNNTIGNLSGCPVCAKNKLRSNSEEELTKFIQSVYPGWVELNDRSILGGKELDILLPDLGIAIEFNGTYWHREALVGRNYHLNKTIGVENFGYRLIHINEDEWIHKQHIVKSRLESLVGTSVKIAARKCVIRQVSPDDASLFLVANHIQGTCVSKYRYGLYLDSRLVAIMTFGTPRFNSVYNYELLRYCSILGSTVIGGASKLLRAFTKSNIGTIISYADRRWSTGNLYMKLGFRFSHFTDPSYRYYKGLDSLSRHQCQKHLLVQQGYDINSTEVEIMQHRGYHRVFDCGNSAWVLEDNK